MAEQKVLKLFKSKAPAMGYVFRSGRTIHFVDGKFATSNPDEIAELTKECEAGHPCYYIDDDQVEIAQDELDPLAALKAKIREEERIKLMQEIQRDMGETKFSGRLEGIANSTSIRSAMVESGSGLATGAVDGPSPVPAGSIKVATATKL